VVAVRLADDTRGRVPFALVGVVLLLGSATFAAAVGTRAPAETDGRVSEAIEEATAVARTALDRAVAGASRAAARDPVLRAANTTFGAAVNESTPFRDSLRIRAYLTAHRALGNATGRVGEVRASVALPPVSDAAALRAAKRRVHVRSRSGDTPRLSVTFRNVSVVATREGQVVERRHYSPTVTVRTPVLALHRRVDDFEDELTRSPTEGGLAARVTAKLATIAMARGAAQYGGAPIGNVLAPRHLEVTTNGALLGVQRRAFGLTDPASRRAHWRASVRTGLKDARAGLLQANWTDTVLGPEAGQVVRSVGDTLIEEAIQSDRPPLTAGVNRTADAAFLSFAAGAEPSRLTQTLREVYRAEVRLRARTRLIENWTERPETPASWELVDTRTRRTTDVETARETPADSPPNGTHRLAALARTVTTTERVVRTYRDGDRTRRTVTVRRTRRLVTLEVLGRHAQSDEAPRRGIEGAHERGGPVGGPNFAGTRERAVRALIAERGGAAALARRAVQGRVDETPVELRVPLPDGLTAWVYRDLAVLRERVRDVSVAVTRRETLTGSPTATLAAELESRRSDFVDPPATYPSVAAKARVAARSAYLDAVTQAVTERADQERALGDRLRSALAGHGVSRDSLAAALDGFDDSGRSDDTAVIGVRAAPAYLTASPVTARHTAAVDGPYYPLVSRNVNLFPDPLGATADAVARELVPRDSPAVGLRAAGSALRSANATLAGSENATLSRHRGRLRGRVQSALDRLGDDLAERIAERHRVVPLAAASEAVSTGFRRWNTTHDRALAAANGSLAAAVEDAPSLPAGTDSVLRDRVGVGLRMSLADAVRSVGVPRSVTDRITEVTRDLARGAVSEAVTRTGEAAVERWVGAAATPVPTGLPVLPLPGYWYATVNVWTVTVRGQYAQFAVRGRSASPVPRRNVTYVREAEPVAVDVDDDGEPERLGQNRPVSFAVDTAVPAVVPGNPPGVGDGTAVETSPGWPAPGPK
jgi:hypothetical protein